MAELFYLSVYTTILGIAALNSLANNDFKNRFPMGTEASAVQRCQGDRIKHSGMTLLVLEEEIASLSARNDAI